MELFLRGHGRSGNKVCNAIQDILIGSSFWQSLGLVAVSWIVSSKFLFCFSGFFFTGFWRESDARFVCAGGIFALFEMRVHTVCYEQKQPAAPAVMFLLHGTEGSLEESFFQIFPPVRPAWSISAHPSQTSDMIARLSSIAARRASTVLATRSAQAFVASNNQLPSYKCDVISTKRSFFKASSPMMPINIVEVCCTWFYVIFTWPKSLEYHDDWLRYDGR